MVQIDLDDYEKMGTVGPITKFERSLKTPGCSDEAREVFYEAGHYFRVSRISTLGWSVTEYDENGHVLRRSASENMGYFDSEEAAHETAKEWVEEHV